MVSASISFAAPWRKSNLRRQPLAIVPDCAFIQIDAVKVDLAKITLAKVVYSKSGTIHVIPPAPSFPSSASQPAISCQNPAARCQCHAGCWFWVSLFAQGP